MAFLYTCTEQPAFKEKNQSHTFFMKGNNAPYFGHFGYFIKGKPYIVEPDAESKRMLVAGFFKKVIITQRFKPAIKYPGRFDLIDIKTPGKTMAYMQLYFDPKICKQFLTFVKHTHK